MHSLEVLAARAPAPSAVSRAALWHGSGLQRRAFLPAPAPGGPGASGHFLAPERFIPCSSSVFPWPPACPCPRMTALDPGSARLSTSLSYRHHTCEDPASEGGHAQGSQWAGSQGGGHSCPAHLRLDMEAPCLPPDELVLKTLVWAPGDS